MFEERQRRDAKIQRLTHSDHDKTTIEGIAKQGLNDPKRPPIYPKIQTHGGHLSIQFRNRMSQGLRLRVLPAVTSIWARRAIYQFCPGTSSC